MKLLQIILLSFLCISCAGFPLVNENIKFSDVKGSWESTGYFHYLKLEFNGLEDSSLITIDFNQKIERISLKNISFNKSEISFKGVKEGKSPKELLFSGILLGNRLVLTEKSSKEDVLSFIRQNELSELRGMASSGSSSQ